MAEESTQIELIRFCDPDSYRFALDKPFVQDGFIYATDGRVAIRMPSDELNTVIESGKRIPRMRDVFTPSEGEYRPWPEIPACETCGDSGRQIGKTCPECGGSGKLYRTKCDACLGLGKVDGCCESCSVDFDVCGYSFAQCYARLISMLPNAEFVIGPGTDEWHVAKIRFDGGEAMLCGRLKGATLKPKTKAKG